jgi:hypothetical protein
LSGWTHASTSSPARAHDPIDVQYREQDGVNGSKAYAIDLPVNPILLTNTQFETLRYYQQPARSSSYPLFATIKKYINMLCRYGLMVYDPGSRFRSKPLSGCIEQSFALSLNDLPIDSGDKLKPLSGAAPGLK